MRSIEELSRAVARMKTDLETLNGERGAEKNYAVRRGDLSRLSEIGSLKSEKVSGAPGEADFNALVDDVQNIRRQLAAISRTLGL